MTAKQLVFHEQAHARILAGIDTLVQAVRGTLGPKARTVVLERPFGAPIVINSGVVVAREIAQVATISANSDRSIGELIANAMEKVGKEGVITVEEGILPGGGVALLRARKPLVGLRGDNPDQDAGIRIVLRALEEPLRQIVANAGAEPPVVLNRVIEGEGSFGFNALTDEYGDMVGMGILDPCKVTRCALQNAASIAGLILTTDCMIAQLPDASRAGAAGADME